VRVRRGREVSVEADDSDVQVGGSVGGWVVVGHGE
jgi:hypothetical protein